jgi:predicted PurR-regulated permease PerM
MLPDTSQPSVLLQRSFLLIAVGAVSLLFLWMVKSFLMALLMGAITAGLAQPIHRWLVSALRGRTVLASFIVVIGLIVLVIGPLVLLLGLVVSQAVEVTAEIRPWVQAQLANPEALSIWLDKLPFRDRLPVDAVLPDRTKVIEVAGGAVQAIGSLVVDSLAAAGRGTVSFILQLFIFLYAVFFFLLSGRQTLDRILQLSPLDADDEEEIVGRFLSVTRATLKGSILIGGIQGALTGIAFALAGVPGAAFWGLIVVVFSVIPGVGAPIVWIPAVFWLVSTGSPLAAGLVAAWCALVVGTIDNLLRPRLIGTDAKMSDLMILISTLGGLSLFGAVGFIVGPVVAALFVTLWDVYGRAFADSLPPVR